MTFIEFEEFRQGLHGMCEDIIHTKGREYACGSEDAFANFKRLAVETESTPLKVAYIFYRKHLDAILNYINTGGRVFSDEPIEKRFADLINYSKIMAGLAAELEDQVQAEAKADARSL